MTRWTASYLNVQWWARHFALAIDENETYKRSPIKAMWWVMKNDKTLALMRMELEMALAEYKVEARKGGLRCD